MTPEPALWCTWDGAAADHRNGRGLSPKRVDAYGYAKDRLGQHAEPLSPGGGMRISSSKGGNKVVLPPPMSMAQAVWKYESATPVEEDRGSEGTSN